MREGIINVLGKAALIANTVEQCDGSRTREFLQQIELGHRYLGTLTKILISRLSSKKSPLVFPDPGVRMLS